MPYIQPFSFVPGNLSSEDIKTLEISAGDYINQQIVTSDIADDLLTEDIQEGEISFIKGGASFVSSDVSGVGELKLKTARAYNTSTAKSNNQVDGIQYQDIYNTFQTVKLDYNGRIVLNFYLKYFVNDNTNVPSNEGPGNGLYQNTFRLKIFEDDGSETIVAETDGYCFEGLGASSDTKDPGDNYTMASHRSLMLTYYLLKTPGTYTFGLVCDPHNERGFATARSMTCEVFYI